MSNIRVETQENDLMKQFLASQEKKEVLNETPHPFAIASRAFLSLMSERLEQYIIIQGESGSGKVYKIPFLCQITFNLH